MFTLTMPAGDRARAARRPGHRTSRAAPAEPRRPRAARRSDRGRAARCASVIACEEPTATARRRRRWLPTNAAACGGVGAHAGRVRGAPSLPPTSPSSASTQSPCRCERGRGSAVAATFSSYGQRGRVEHDRAEPVVRRPAAARSASSTWSRCSATSTAAPSATARAAAVTGASRPPWKRTAFSLTCRMTGRPTRSAPATIASACSRVITLKAATPRPCAGGVGDEVGGRAAGIRAPPSRQRARSPDASRPESTTPRAVPAARRWPPRPTQATASVSTSGQAPAPSSPAASAATQASPAPVGLPGRAAGEAARQLTVHSGRHQPVRAEGRPRRRSASAGVAASGRRRRRRSRVVRHRRPVACRELGPVGLDHRRAGREAGPQRRAVGVEAIARIAGRGRSAIRVA